MKSTVSVYLDYVPMDAMCRADASNFASQRCKSCTRSCNLTVVGMCLGVGVGMGIGVGVGIGVGMDTQCLMPMPNA